MCLSPKFKLYDILPQLGPAELHAGEIEELR
jgi:hypothetical protein